MFATEDDLKNQSRREAYLVRAVQHVSDALIAADSPSGFDFGNVGRKVDFVHLIQAEVLLANFFYYYGRFVEARLHTSSAVSLALSCDLHKICPSSSLRNLNTPQDRSKMHLVPGAEEETTLPPPVDSIEENERIAAFWQVYVLDKTWSVAAHSGSGLLAEDGSPRMTVDTPWPLAIESFAEVLGLINTTMPVGFCADAFNLCREMFHQGTEALVGLFRGS